MANRSHVDEIWLKLGIFGKYQIRHFFVTIFAALPMACHVVSFVFIGYEPKHKCAPEPNITESGTGTGNGNVTYGECFITLSANNTVQESSCIYGHTYETNRDHSIVTEWDLVCGDDALSTMSQTLVSGGMFLGAFASQLADRYGRRPVHCAFNLGLFIVTFAMAFNRNFTVFMVLRFLTGACQQGMLLTVFTLWIEMMPTDNRTMIGILNAFLWSASFCIVLPFAYGLKDYGWRMVQLGLSLLSSITLIEYCLIDESLRWLLANDKHKEANDLITKAANMNGVDKDVIVPFLKPSVLKDVTLDVVIDESKAMSDDVNVDVHWKAVSVKTPTFWERNRYCLNLLTVPSLRRNSLVIWTTWVVNNLAYYGLLFMMPSLAGDMYTNYLYGGITEVAATCVLVVILKYLSRRNGLIFFHFVGGVCLVTASLVGTFTDNSTATTVLTLIGKGAITSSFNGIYLYTPELFPTNLRNAGMGMASGFGRFAGMLAPFSVYLAKVADWAPGILFGILCFIVSGLLRLVPETKGKELAQTVDELKEWENKKDEDIMPM